MQLVSIICPYKNAASCLEDMVGSILDQSYENWELLLIDDHSIDESDLVLRQFTCKDKRIRVIENEGDGIIAALQLGLQHSKGEFVTRMDSDDKMPANRLQTMVEKLKNCSDKTIVTGKVEYFSDEPVSEGYKKYEQWLNERIDFQDHYLHIYRECVVASPNWMARTQELIQYNIFRELIYPEDYDMVFRWFFNDFKIVGIDELTLYWREHPKRTSRNSEVYAQKSFFDLKLSWFLKLNPDLDSVGIVGYGKKGKICATFFERMSKPYKIYELQETNSGKLNIASAHKIDSKIILVARYPENPSELQKFLEQQGYVFGKTAYWV